MVRGLVEGDEWSAEMLHAVLCLSMCGHSDSHLSCAIVLPLLPFGRLVFPHTVVGIFSAKYKGADSI